jgi:cytochrome c
LAEWVTDPKAFLRNALDNPKAKSKMSFKLKKGGDDVAAYLASMRQ